RDTQRIGALSYSWCASTPGPSRLSLHDALPIMEEEGRWLSEWDLQAGPLDADFGHVPAVHLSASMKTPSKQNTLASLSANLELRSEEHTSELQSRENLVCRLLLEKKQALW